MLNDCCDESPSSLIVAKYYSSLLFEYWWWLCISIWQLFIASMIWLALAFFVACRSSTLGWEVFPSSDRVKLYCSYCFSCGWLRWISLLSKLLRYSLLSSSSTTTDFEFMLRSEEFWITEFDLIGDCKLLFSPRLLICFSSWAFCTLIFYLSSRLRQSLLVSSLKALFEFWEEKWRIWGLSSGTLF